MGFDFIAVLPLLLPCCGFFFVFRHRVSFLVGSSVFFVGGCSAVSCTFGASVRRHELMSFYSAILPPSPNVISLSLLLSLQDWPKKNNFFLLTSLFSFEALFPLVFSEMYIHAPIFQLW